MKMALNMLTHNQGFYIRKSGAGENYEKAYFEEEQLFHAY